MQKARGLWSNSKYLPEVKKELWAKVPKLNYLEARRYTIPLYTALSKELYEAGCIFSVIYFEKMVAKEKSLFHAKSISKHISEEYDFLLKILENIKNAEILIRQAGDRKKAMELLLETAHLIEESEFLWLAEEFYNCLKEILLELHVSVPELEAKILYYFAKFLSTKKGGVGTTATTDLVMAGEISKCQMWYTTEEADSYLSHDIAVLLATLYLREAQKVAFYFPEKAADLARNAILVITEDGILYNKLLYCEACLEHSKYLIFLEQFKDAEKVLVRVQPYIMSAATPDIKCDYFLNMGICDYYLSKNSIAMRNFKRALRIAHIYGLHERKGHAIFNMGRIYALIPKEQLNAKKCFLVAREIFTKLNDLVNIKRTNYLIAMLQAEEILPSFIRFMKESDYKFCSLVSLRLWKDQIKPFWTEEDLRTQQGDNVTTDTVDNTIDDQVKCLLEDKLYAYKSEEILPLPDTEELLNTPALVVDPRKMDLVTD